MLEYYNVEEDFLPILENMALLDPPRERSLEQLRNGTDYAIFGEPEPVRDVRSLRIPVDGAELGARFYFPFTEPAALVVYYHGGGWVMGGLESHDRGIRSLVNRAGVAALSIDYRMAPEHPFPVPFEDARAALAWAVEHGGDLTGRELPLWVAGDSAGGNLAAGVALAARSGGRELAGQLLFYPSIDGHCSGASFSTRGDCPILTSHDMRWYWSTYSAGQDCSADWRFSPARAEDLAGVAPAIIAIAGVDPLRDDGLDYASALARADVPVSMLYFPRQPHGFFNFLPLVPSAMRAFDEIAARLVAMLR